MCEPLQTCDERGEALGVLELLHELGLEPDQLGLPWRDVLYARVALADETPADARVRYYEELGLLDPPRDTGGRRVVIMSHHPLATGGRSSGRTPARLVRYW